MIEYSKTENEQPERFMMYFAGEGSWGDASDIVVIDVSEIDGHYTEMIDEVADYKRPDFMRWYVDNQTHDQTIGEYTNCEICERWEDGTEDEIQEALEDED